MEEIDLKLVFNKLLRKWYWFAISVVLCLALAIFYLASTERIFLVESTLQLKDQSLGNKGASKEQFMTGLGLLAGDSEIEDEIGILTSYSLIKESVEGLGLEVSYFKYPDFMGRTGKVFAQEEYPGKFSVAIDTAGWQLLYTPIHITFLNENQYRVEASNDDNQIWLYNAKSHEVIQHGSPVEIDTIVTAGSPIKTKYLNIELEAIDPKAWNDDNSYYITLKSLNDVTGHYKKSLTTEAISENSNIIKLSLKGSAPRKDIVFLNSLTNTYIEHDVAKKNRLGQKTIQFIDFQLQGVTDSLRRAESSLQSFRANSKVMDVSAASQSLNDQLFGLEEKQAQLSVQNKYYQYMANYLAKNDNINDIVAPSSVGIQDELLNNLLLQLNTLNTEKISKDFSSSQHNPVLQVLDKKIMSTKKMLIDNIENLIATNNIGLQEANRRVAEIKSTINRLPQNERDLTDIKRRFTFNDNIYSYLLQKRAEAGIAIAANIADKSVIDIPRQIGTGPVSPNALLTLLMAFIAGLILPFGVFFVTGFFQSKLENDDQAVQWLKLPLVEKISQLNGKEKQGGYVGDSYLAHTFRYVRQHLDVLKLNKEIKTVGFTSAKSGEGKTFCALNLALSYAHAGRKTLLIEADLHQPMLSRNFEVSAKPGLTDFLVDKVEKIIQNTGTPYLDIITSGTPTNNPSDLLNQSNLDFLIKKLKDQYEIIIFDTPPVGLIADYLILSRQIDYTLLVVRQDYSEKDEIMRLNKIAKDYNLQGGILYNGATVAKDYKGYYKKVSKAAV